MRRRMGIIMNKMIKDYVKTTMVKLGINRKPQKPITLDEHYVGDYKDSIKGRIQKVMDCPDNKYIPRVDGAGDITRNVQTMHNGIKIYRGSYYPELIEPMLILNKGVHEPQEEKMFMDILKKIPDNATMIELGSYWAFYSMWFQKEIPGAINYMVEPEKEYFEYGKMNFKLNNMKGNFICSKVGKDYLTVDKMVEDYNIKKINLLHSDIQGFELEMLDGAKKSISAGKIDYIFVSTHTQKLHEDCIKFLKEHNFKILYSADYENETYSYDGIIVAQYHLYKKG